MQELSHSFDPRSATCAICNGLCDLTTCKTNENGDPVHEHCYAMSLTRAARDRDS